MKNNSPEERELLNGLIGDGGFLQSEIWRQFQERVGHSTEHWEDEVWWANMIEYRLLGVGKYGYAPRGPVLKVQSEKFKAKSAGYEKQDAKMHSTGMQDFEMRKFFEKAKQKGWGWLRVEPDNEAVLERLRTASPYRIVPAPHSIQPREILALDTAPEPETLLKQMKSKTRYNIRLAERRGVHVYQTHEKRHQEAFMALVGVTARRDGIRPHAKSYYEAMFASFPPKHWELLVAEYEGKIIAANLVIFFGAWATYLHGSSADEHRDVMAPYLLQWRAIEEARRRGCQWYDFGGVDTRGSEGGWAGITRFKVGFAPETPTRHFPGTFDIILDPVRYRLYRWLRAIKRWL